MSIYDKIYYVDKVRRKANLAIIYMDKINENIDEESKEVQEKEKVNFFKEAIEWCICVIIAFVIYLLLNYFVGTISGVKQVSMLPTAEEGDRVLLQRQVLFKTKFKCGDIVTFKAPLDDETLYMVDSNGEEAPTEASFRDSITANYEERHGFDKFMYEFFGVGQVSYIKRVIGVAGDHIEIKDDGYVYINGEKLEETYLKDGSTNKVGEFTDVVVPEGTVYVLGDNRFESKDSRFFGCIPVDKVNGYALLRVWPFNKFGKI